MIFVFGSQGKEPQVTCTAAAAESFFSVSGFSNNFTELENAGTKSTRSKTIKHT